MSLAGGQISLSSSLLDSQCPVRQATAMWQLLSRSWGRRETLCPCAYAVAAVLDSSALDAGALNEMISMSVLSERLDRLRRCEDRCGDDDARRRDRQGSAMTAATCAEVRTTDTGEDGVDRRIGMSVADRSENAGEDEPLSLQEMLKHLQASYKDRASGPQALQMIWHLRYQVGVDRFCRLPSSAMPSPSTASASCRATSAGC